jgi:hypothetical protein
VVRARGGGAGRRGAGARWPGAVRFAAGGGGLPSSSTEASSATEPPFVPSPFDSLGVRGVPAVASGAGGGFVGEEGVLASVLIKLGGF